MNILISGTGIAGLTLAYWLKRYGFNPTVVERAPLLVTGGYKLDVRGRGLDVLRRMGIYEEVLASSTDMQSARLIDKEGKVIHEMSGDAFGNRVDDDLEIIRGQLCQILKSKIPDVECVFGDVVEEVSQSPDDILVTFKHAGQRRFDLVIGADGLHSNIRQLVFGDETSFLRNLGLYLCVFTVPNDLGLDRTEMQYTEFGRMAAAWSARGEPDMKACFGFTSPTIIDLQNKFEQQQAIKQRYADIGGEVPKFLQKMPDSPDFYFDIAAQIHMDTWSKGRVVLVGDAAYCASPLSGQGNSLALIGAYVLAGELVASQGRYQEAFMQYEQQMRSFVNINQQLGIKAAKLMTSQEKPNVFVWGLQQLMRMVPGWVTRYIINRSTRRIHHAANAIQLKNYG